LPLSAFFLDCWMTSSRYAKNVLPRSGSSAFGEPMRDDSPAERMMAASTGPESARDALRGGLRFGGLRLGGLHRLLLAWFFVVLADDSLVLDVRGAATHGN